LSDGSRRGIVNLSWHEKKYGSIEKGCFANKPTTALLREDIQAVTQMRRVSERNKMFNFPAGNQASARRPARTRGSTLAIDTGRNFPGAIPPTLPVGRVTRAGQAIAMTVGLWARRSRTRRTLADLDDQQLADIGRSRSETRHESAKWFWLR
jgi:uncharacterized protein YjiS (DUF1127 family)